MSGLMSGMTFTSRFYLRLTQNPARLVVIEPTKQWDKGTQSCCSDWPHGMSDFSGLNTSKRNATHWGCWKDVWISLWHPRFLRTEASSKWTMTNASEFCDRLPLFLCEQWRIRQGLNQWLSIVAEKWPIIGTNFHWEVAHVWTVP